MTHPLEPSDTSSYRHAREYNDKQPKYQILHKMIKHKASRSKEKVLITDLFCHLLFLASLLCPCNFFLSIILIYLSHIWERNSLFQVLRWRTVNIISIIIRIVISKIEILLTLDWFALLFFRLHLLHHLTIRLIIRLRFVSALWLRLLLANYFGLLTFLTILFFLLRLFLFLDLLLSRNWGIRFPQGGLGWVEEISIALFFLFLWIIVSVDWLFPLPRLAN